MMSKKEKKLVLVLGVAVILIIVVLYFGFLQRDDVSDSNDFISSGSAPSLEFINEATIRSISEINLDFRFLKSDDFALLNINSNIPIKPQTSGRTNPFVPY